MDKYRANPQPDSSVLENVPRGLKRKLSSSEESGSFDRDAQGNCQTMDQSYHFRGQNPVKRPKVSEVANEKDSINILDLPNEILLRICGHLLKESDLKFGKVGDFRLVCRRFCSLAYDTKFVNSLFFQDYFSNERIQLAKKVIGRRQERLRFLTLAYNPDAPSASASRSFFDNLEHCPDLKQINIFNAALVPIDYQKLATFKSLKVLNLDALVLRGKTIQITSLPPNLTDFTASGSFKLVGPDFHCNKLHSLSLSLVRGDSLAFESIFLTSRESLKSVLMDSYDFDDSVLGFLCNCPSIDTLEVSGHRIIHFQSLERLAKLEVLKIRGPNNSFINNSLKTLKSLTLSNCRKMDSFGIGELARICSQLKIIRIQNKRNLQPGDLWELRRCKNLRRIYLCNLENITKADVESLIKELHNLEEVTVQACLPNSDLSSLKSQFPGIFQDANPPLSGRWILIILHWLIPCMISFCLDFYQDKWGLWFCAVNQIFNDTINILF